MIRNTEEFLAALRAARRASTALVSIRTADPASAIALTTRSLNGYADGTSLLSWDIMTGLSAVNGRARQCSTRSSGNVIPRLWDRLMRYPSR